MKPARKKSGSEEAAACGEEVEARISDVIQALGAYREDPLRQSGQLALVLNGQNERDASPQRVEKELDEVLRTLWRDS